MPGAQPSVQPTHASYTEDSFSASLAAPTTSHAPPHPAGCPLSRSDLTVQGPQGPACSFLPFQADILPLVLQEPKMTGGW